MLEFKPAASDLTVTSINGSDSDLRRCKMLFYGNLANANGEMFFPAPISFNPEPPSIPSYPAVAAAAGKIRTYADAAQGAFGLDLADIEVLTPLSTILLSILTPQFQIDVLSVSRPMETARINADGLYVGEEESFTMLSKECLGKEPVLFPFLSIISLLP